MLDRYRIINADSHIIEPPSMWAKYLEPEFKEFSPSGQMKVKGEEMTEKISEQVHNLGNKQMMSAHPNAYF